MRRTLLLAAPFALLVLVLASVALAGNAGLAPEPAHSPNASRISDAYWLIFGFTAAIFVIVEGALVVFIVRYRSRGRGRTVDGPQVHGHTRLELIWTVIPVLILAAIASFIFYKLPGISDVPAASAGDRLNVRVDARQFYWQFTYPDGQISINTLHVPAHEVVSVDLHAEDVIHSFWVPQLGGKTDAIPGRTNHTWFSADKVGTFYGNCAELCGLYHARMPITVVSEPRATFRQFLQGAPAQLGKAEFNGVCVTCHGIGGKGGYGPALAGNPLVQQRSGIETIVRNGRNGPIGQMPAVGRGWSDAQMKALTDYLARASKAGTLGR
ncbi:MAG: cytochrome c oxidase subunit II [Gaiellaceae bacterium]